MADNDTTSTNTSSLVIETLYARSLEENMKFIRKDENYPYLYHIEIGFVPGMRVKRAAIK